MRNLSRSPRHNTIALGIGLATLLATSPAHAAKMIAVLPLDVTNAAGKIDKAAQASLEEALRNVTTRVLRPSGWTVLSGETILQVLADNGVDTSKCGEGSCQLEAAREIKVDKFIGGSVQYVEGELTATIRLIDTRTGQILSSVSLSGKGTRDLREQFESGAADFFSQAEIVDTSAAQEETTGELFLQAIPPDATFQLDDGAPTDLIPGRNTVLTLSLGTHHLLLRKNGLQDFKQDVFIERGKPATVRATLLAPPSASKAIGQAYLTVDSTPREARIFLDGRDTGKVTPANFAGLPAGEHQIVLQHDLFLDWQHRIVLKADDVQGVKPDLTSNFGALSIVSQPPGATVYVDGRQQKGVTPLKLEHFQAKAFRVRLTLPLYDTVEKTVVISPGETTNVKETLKPQFGTLVLRPNPDGATVYLNDVQLPEQTPITRERLAARSYRLRVTLPLYRDLDRTVRVEAGRTTTVDDALIPTTGGMVVTAEVSGEPFTGAAVFIDGEQKGTTPLSLATVPEGTVTVEVREPLYRSFTTKTIIVARQQAKVNAPLVAEFGLVQASATPGGTVTVDGTSIGVADGRTYKVPMGSHHIAIVPDDHAHYRSYEQDAIVEVGGTVTVDAKLVARLGSVIVQTSPPGAAITFDGQRKGESPQRLADLFASQHALRLELEKYQDWTQEVTVEEGKTAAVDVTLKSVDLVKYEADVRSRKMTAGVVASVATGVLGIGAGVAQLLAHGYAGTESSSLQAYNADTTTTAIASDRAAAQSAYNSGKGCQIASIALGIAAAGTAVWAGYEWETMPEAPTPETVP